MPAQRLPSVPTLRGLLAGLVDLPPEQDRPLRGVTENSQAVEPGFLFCARAGANRHGLDFIQDVLAAGAAAVLWEPPAESRESGLQACREAGVPCVEISGLGGHLGVLADRFYGEPSAHLQVVGVTGTDGKTSVSQFLAQTLNTSATPCAVLGTLGYGLHNRLQPASRASCR